MYHDGQTFAKGRAIDYGIQFLSGNDWIVHLDADIWLPPMARQWIDWSLPEKDCIYGIDRFNCVGWEAWRKFIALGPGHHHQVQNINHGLLIPPPFPAGSRISQRDAGGYIPIGFFQMWHGSRRARYPLYHGGANRSDVLFALQWPLGKRQLLEEIYAVHVDSDAPRMGKNWWGRVSGQFGPVDPFKSRPEAKGRRPALGGAGPMGPAGYP